MTEIEFNTLYGVNQELYKQIASPSDAEIDRQLSKLGAWLSVKFQNTYFMLLCREKYDFTIFKLENSQYFEATKELKEVLQSRGTIIEIVFSPEHQFFECWVRDEETEEVSMYAFFPCDEWVITIE